METYRIAVAGTGYVGLSIATLLAQHHEAATGLDGAAITAMWDRMQAQSAHYSVDGVGTITQHVLESNTAWACGRWVANCESISIEHANNSTSPWTVSEATLESGAHLVAALLIKYGLGYPRWGGNVRPHKQIVATACPGELAGSQNAHYAIVLGNEVKGVKQSVVDMSDGCLEIPQFGTKHDSVVGGWVLGVGCWVLGVDGVLGIEVFERGL